ncbi:MAG: MG2 domain-containing protein [Bacteroidota bacterium]|nr:MG2 domain-containing protein [Bacteroidota bacterium]
METSTIKKGLKVGATAILAFSLLAWVTPSRYYQQALENEFIKDLKKKLTSYNEEFPEDRVYIQFDKPMYEPGETIWFSANLLNAKNMQASDKSDILHVDFVNPKGSVERSIKLIAKNGRVAGDFDLDKEALGGMYKIRAYTNWMKNSGEDNVFEKEIQVQDVVLPNLKMKLDFEKKAFGAGDEVIAKLVLNTNENKPLADYKIKLVANLNGQKFIEKAEVTDEEGIKFIKFTLPKDLKTNDGLLNVMIDYNGSTESVSRSIPIVLNKIDLALLPEGGDLVEGLQSNVAIKALNEFGKPADIEGVVLNSKGTKVSTFSSFYNGMGAFNFTPAANETYTVKITKPEGITEVYKMPEVLKRGYVLNVNNTKDGELTATIRTTETEQLSLVAQVRGTIYYSTAIDAKKGDNAIIIPTEKFPVGVAQVTLFDAKGIERAERLSFVNSNNQLQISIETDKEKYLPREKVKLTVRVKDEKGMPAPANVALSVVNDQFLSFADDKTGNILSELLLQQDLKGKVEEPAFYFDKKEEKAEKALDYLLMTSGWRRFTWEQIMKQEKPLITYANEKAIVTGTVVDANTSKPLSKVKVKVGSIGEVVETDENGKFTFKKMDLTSYVTLNFTSTGYSYQSLPVYEYNQNLMVYLYKPVSYPSYTYATGTGNAAGVPKQPSGKGGVRNKNNVPKKAERNDVPANNVMVDNVQMVPQENVANNVAIAEPGVVVKEDEGKVKDVKKGKDKEKKNVLSAKADLNEIALGDLDDDGVFVNDNRNNFFKNGEMAKVVAGKPMQAITYYRAKQFYAPQYEAQENVETRTDFRNTVYWNPNIEVDHTGKKTVEFYMSDDVSSFRTTVEGISNEGTIGRGEKTFFTQLPFGMSTKIPVEVATEDVVSIPLTLTNNTDKPLGGKLSVLAPEALLAVQATPEIQTIMPGKAKTIYLDYKVSDKIGVGDFTVTFKACGLGDAFTQKIRIAPKGFPAGVSFSGQEVEKEYTFSNRNVVRGSLKAVVTAFPNVVSDLMKGVEGILREPSGCFEQTSMSSYPNAMVLDYLKTSNSDDEKTISRATELLGKGYNRLITFETKEKGYEWFGSNPGHEALSAYGLMQFNDMKNVGANVDQKMVGRTAEWLMSRKDGKGGFQQNSKALDNFGRASKEITDAYIVYSLSEAGYTDIKKEFNAAYDDAVKSKDPYTLALVTNAAFNLKETKKASDALSALLKLQANNGSWTGTKHSITYSTGQSLIVETTSLATMAMLKETNKNGAAVNKSVEWLIAARNGSGTFGNTQGTVLALKALTDFAKASKKTTEDGTIVVYVDGKKAAEKSYKAGDKGAIVFEGMEEFMKEEGKHTVKVKYLGVKTPLPYTVAVNWNTYLPVSNSECVVDLKTIMAAKTANVGETVRLTTTITNKKNEGIPTTMVIVGIPAGFTVQPWQLKELQEKKAFDYYEIKGNNVAIYYRCMAPSAVKEIGLDLKAEMPGEYDAPASSAYLYYTNEFKTWSGADKVTIKKS